MRKHWILGTAFTLAACGGNTEDDSGPLLDYAPKPDVPNAAMLWELPEQSIKAGRDVQTCFYFEETTEDLFINAFDSTQGKFGHHLILFKARITEEPGTVRDCSNPEDMLRLTPVIASIQFGLDRFPAGMAIRVPKGSQLVLQQHYVNTSNREIKVKDWAYFETIPEAEVTTKAGFFGVSDIEFVLPATEEPQTISFECEVPFETTLLLAGPHMHEWGTVFKAEMGPRENLTTILDIQRWEASFRDEPPVEKFQQAHGLQLRQGDVIRTHCTFKNTTGKELAFPEEMCATYGYYFPAPTGHEEFTCGGVRL